MNRPRTLVAITLLLLPCLATAAEDLDYTIELTAPVKLFDGKESWAHPRAGTIPPRSPGNDSDQPLVVMTLQTIRLGASDVFSQLHEMRTADLGKTWTTPEPIPGFEWKPIDGGPAGKPQWQRTVCDFTPRWHAASGKLLGTGQTVIYEGGQVAKVRPRDTAYAVYDAATATWSPWQALKMPDDPKFGSSGAGSTQRLDLPNGDVLLPVYFKTIEATRYASSVVRCRFDGTTLSYVEHGSELTVDVARGLYEPSLTQYRGRFYLTLRNDERGYVAISDDGLKFSEPKVWTWDDGTVLETYNTQQHWVTHSDGLFLVYTRRTPTNQHVFRSRAPLFIARVDPEKVQVIRSTERELMPNRGARLGNFAVTDVSPHETWVTDAEWMQPKGIEKYGADGSVWVSKIKWNKPNKLASQ